MKKSYKIVIGLVLLAVLAITYKTPYVEAKLNAIRQLEIDLTNGRIPVAAGNLSGMSGDITVASTGVTTIANLAVTEGNLSAYTADALHANRIARATYDFAVEGGAHKASYDLGVDLPDNAIVTRSWYEVITTFESATDAALIAIDIPTDDVAGIVASTAISAGGNVWDAGYHEAIQDGTAAAFSDKTTAARAVTFTLASSTDGAGLTAGKLVLFMEYVLSD